MEHTQPMNRAQRRRIRRTTALAGAGLAFSGSLVGLYPGGTRVPRAYAQVSTLAANCNVATWDELNAALGDLWSTVNYKVNVDGTAPLACTTITFTADISDADVQRKVANSNVSSGYDYPGQLENILIPPGQDVTIDGNGYTLDLSGQWGSGLLATPESTGPTPSDLVIRDLEITGEPYNRFSASPTLTGPSVYVSSSHEDTFGLVIEDSYIHGNTSTTDPALLVSTVVVVPSVTITRSEFANNGQGAVAVSVYGDPYGGSPIGTGEVSVASSYFHDNTASGGWVSAGGAVTVDGPMPVSISDSTFADNHSTVGGGAIHVQTSSTVTIGNSTFSDNAGVGAGSVYLYVTGDGPSVESAQDTLAIDHTTMVGGSATSTSRDLLGEEVLVVSPNSYSASFDFTNSVVWGSSADPDVSWYSNDPDYFSVRGSITNSVFGSIDGAPAVPSSNTNNPGNFNVAGLTFGDHGGTVLPSFRFVDSPSAPADPHIPTFLPASDSVVVDAAGAGGPATDQRGVLRPQGDAADIGSVEVERLVCAGPFTDVGAFECVVPDGVRSIDVLVVGGGGGGGAGFEGGGGGGGGQVKVCTIPVTPGSTLSGAVAAGGAGAEGVVSADTGIQDGTNGGLSSLAGCTAVGGAGGKGNPLLGSTGFGEGGASGNGKAGGIAKDQGGTPLSGGGGGGASAVGTAASGSQDALPCLAGVGGAGLKPSEVATPEAFASVTTTAYGGGGGGGNGCEGPGGNGGNGGGGNGGATNLGVSNGQLTHADPARGAPNSGGGGGGGAQDYNLQQGPGAAGGSGYVEIRESSAKTVTVTPPAAQTITYGATPNLTPNDDFPQGVSWGATPPTCDVFDGTEKIVARPVPAGTYSMKCTDGTPPPGYTVVNTATPTTLIVNKAPATLTYNGSSGGVSGSTITLSASVSPSNLCPASGIVFTVNGQVVADPTVPYPVIDGQVYDIEVSYTNDNCQADPVLAAVVVGGMASASNGGGWYNVQGVGRVNFGYTVQINKSRTGSTQVSGQMLWNSRNSTFRFKGNIASFVRTTTGCTTGQICGRIVGTGTLRTRSQSGEWVVVGTNVSYKAAVIDVGTASVCTGGKKKVCSTVNKPDFFGLDVTGPTITGEQVITSSGWPSPVQLSGGNLVIK